MRFATLRTDYGTTAARLENDELIPLDAADVGEMLAGGGEGPGRPRADAAPVPVAEADFAPLVPRPGKVVCVGLNYRSHILETGRELPEYPTLFAKYAETLMGPRDDLVIPSVSEKVDWEAELGVVIGSPVYRATPGEAAGAIAGYTVLNDVSMRDWQRRTLQWLQGKMFERTTPAGPYLVTADEVDISAQTISTTVWGAPQASGLNTRTLASPGIRRAAISHSPSTVAARSPTSRSRRSWGGTQWKN